MKKTFLVFSIISILLYGCQEEDVINPNDLESTQACQDHLTAENIFIDVGRIVEEGLQDNGQSKSCPNYQLMNINTTDIDTLIIDFGNVNCFHNNKLRRGKIIVTYTNKYHNPYAVITSTFENYYLNNILIQGERVVTNQGVNDKENMWFTVDINNASITTSNGTINWNSNRVKEWISGENTYLDISDDRYKITGTANGNGVNGNDFTMTILDTLNIDLGCLPSCIIKSGSAKISPNGYSDRIINYGDSLCNCNVDVRINETTYPIVINN